MDVRKDPFYDSSAWLAARARVLMRDDYLCQRCKSKGRIRCGDTVHHIVPLEQAPELALTESNLVTLCRKCHEQLHPERARKRLERGAPPGTLIVKL